jgi:hypothetical protein
MSELGTAKIFSMAEAVGIIATMFIVLYFFKKAMQSLSVYVVNILHLERMQHT